jgi:restriction endonuclease S subunit
MSSYAISNPALNPKRVFILQKSELENRYDPSWYVYLQSIQGFKHKKVAFKSLLLNNPQYGANEIGINRETNNEPRYIRITDINEFGELENVLGKTASTIEEKYFLQENDLLLARSGNTVGKSYLHKNKGYDCFFAGYMIRFKIDETKVLPKYIFAYTQTELYKKWVKAIQRTTGQPNINAEEYRSLEIPLPDKKIQEKVIETYFDFIFQKQTNEAEAEKLLASIDDYLLNELGITLPTPTENTLKNRMFIRTFKQIQNKRVDPFFHQDKFINNLEIIEKGKYPVKQLKEIISGGLIKGSLPKQDEKDGECSVVQINSINNDGTISLDDLLTAKPIFSNSQKLSENDVLVVITGATIGKIAFWNYEGEYFLGGDIVKFQTNEFAENSFVYNYLRSCLMQTEIKRNVTGATNGHLAPSDVANLPIPVPPLDKQKEIADHITEIRNQAQALKDKTKGLLKKASEEIEEILLN